MNLVSQLLTRSVKGKEGRLPPVSVAFRVLPDEDTFSSIIGTGRAYGPSAITFCFQRSATAAGHRHSIASSLAYRAAFSDHGGISVSRI